MNFLQRHSNLQSSSYPASGLAFEIQFGVGKCSLGSVLVAKTGQGICAILLGIDPGEMKSDLQARFPLATLAAADASFAKVVSKVIDFIEAPASGLDLPLDLHGTAFQHRVWQELCNIPVGSTASYGEIARRMGVPSSVRAVGRACCANPVAVVVPCHRVVRGDGALAGYRWGSERKRALLSRESAHGVESLTT
ncbi:MAG TPA: methylated-DNA--[protein]-cysteine S-methyltransferase [Terriglobales bacterium]|nr:methylated-DNA--[protein]-cysteine S-methyltransferase [Terriglobales bacterium]